MASQTTPRPSATDRARDRAELAAALPHILAAPADVGTLDMIVVRPEHGLRRDVAHARLTASHGVEGDHWSRGCWRTTEDGRPHPDVQICLMMSRMIGAIAGERAWWAAAGDNLFIDMNLTPANLPPGSRIAIGSCILEITAEPHNGCQSFIDRYGRDACVFVNTGDGKTHRLRGIYARVVQDGTVTAGDAVRKLAG